MSCKQIPTGDRGQRYEVTAVEVEGGKRRAVGWSATADGAEQLKKAFDEWPAFRDAAVRDRQAEERA